MAEPTIGPFGTPTPQQDLRVDDPAYAAAVQRLRRAGFPDEAIEAALQNLPTPGKQPAPAVAGRSPITPGVPPSHNLPPQGQNLDPRRLPPAAMQQLRRQPGPGRGTMPLPFERGLPPNVDLAPQPYANQRQIDPALERAGKYLTTPFDRPRPPPGAQRQGMGFSKDLQRARAHGGAQAKKQGLDTGFDIQSVLGRLGGLRGESGNLPAQGGVGAPGQGDIAQPQLRRRGPQPSLTEAIAQPPLSVNGYTPPAPTIPPEVAARMGGGRGQRPPTGAAGATPQGQPAAAPGAKKFLGKGGDFWRMILEGGLGTMAASQQTGASALGSIGQGFLGALAAADQRMAYKASVGSAAEQKSYDRWRDTLKDLRHGKATEKDIMEMALSAAMVEEFDPATFQTTERLDRNLFDQLHAYLTALSKGKVDGKPTPGDVTKEGPLKSPLEGKGTKKPKTITSQEEFDDLKSGDSYIGPDGLTRTKP